MPPSARVDVELGFKDEAYGAGMQRARESMNAFARLANKFGVMLSARFVGSWVKQTIAWADNVSEMSDKLGVSTDAFQEFEYAAMKTGASVESFTMALRTLIKAQQDAIAGGPRSAAFKPFETLGISFESVKRADYASLFYKVADAFRASSQEGQHLDAVISLFGRGAMDLMGALREGLGGIREEAHKTGQVMEESVVRQLGNINDQLELMGRQVKIGGGGWLSAIWTTGMMVAGGALKLGEFARLSVLEGKSINDAWEGANAAANEYGRVMQGLPPAGKSNFKPGPYARATGEQFGPPKPRNYNFNPAAMDWKAYTIGGGDERTTRLLFGAADALARIGLFRGAYDPGEATRQKQLRELQTLNRNVAETNRLLQSEEI